MLLRSIAGPWMSIADLLLDAARERPRDEAVFDGRRRLDFAALAARAQALARGLARRGVGRGARVAVVSTNNTEYVECYGALALLGAVCVPVNWRLRAGEVRHVLGDAEVGAVIAEARFTQLVDEALAEGAPCGLRLSIGAAAAGWLPFEAAPPARRAARC
jgi:fatty-acyl-CoA synthase